MASRRTKKFWALFFGSALFLFLVISLTGFAYFRQETVSRSTPAFAVNSQGSAYDINQLRNQNLLLNVGIGFTAFSPEKGLKVEIAFDPKNNLTTSHGEPKVPVCVSYRDTDLEFKQGQEMGAEGTAVPFSGDVNVYPFDVYTGQLILKASLGKDNESCTDPLPINPSVLGSTEGFVVTAQVFPGFNDDDTPDYSTARIEFTVRRIRVHQVFSTLIFMVMWILTLMLSYITAWTWKGGKRVEMGVISMNSALLFAIPRVRDSQPGIPKMGILQDMIGYCWNVLIIAISLFSLQINFILRKERKKQWRKSREDGSTLLMVMEEIVGD